MDERMSTVLMTTDEIYEIIDEVIIENGGKLFTADEKEIITNNLKKYPHLDELIRSSSNPSQIYEKYCPYRYINNIKDSELDRDIAKEIIRISGCEYALGSFLLTEGNQFDLKILRDIDNILEQNPELYQYNYGDNFWKDFFDIYPEFLVYDKLKKMGYNPQHEPNVRNTASKPDFKILDEENPIFIEIKTRHNSLSEELSYGFRPHPLFFNLDEDTLKTDTVLITTILNQVSNFNIAQPNIPVAVVIYCIEEGILSNYLNIFGNKFEERLTGRIIEDNIVSSFTFPENLKMIITFSFSINHKLRMRIYTKIGYSSNFCDMVVDAYKERNE